MLPWPMPGLASRHGALRRTTSPWGRSRAPMAPTSQVLAVGSRPNVAALVDDIYAYCRRAPVAPWVAVARTGLSNDRELGRSI